MNTNGSYPWLVKHSIVCGVMALILSGCGTGLPEQSLMGGEQGAPDLGAAMSGNDSGDTLLPPNSVISLSEIAVPVPTTEEHRGGGESNTSLSPDDCVYPMVWVETNP